MIVGPSKSFNFNLSHFHFFKRCGAQNTIVGQSKSFSFDLSNIHSFQSYCAQIGL